MIISLKQICLFTIRFLLFKRQSKQVIIKLLISENSIEKARKLVLRCYNSLASQQELSGTQVTTYLMDSGDYYTGHTFVNIFLIGIERYLQNELNQAKTTITSSLTTAPPLNSNLSDTTVDEEEQFLVEHSSDRQKLVLVNLRVVHCTMLHKLHQVQDVHFKKGIHLWMSTLKQNLMA